MNQHNLLVEDLETICDIGFIPWADLRDRTIFITGGTGLIGSFLISALLKANLKFNLNLKILALVRNKVKATSLFGVEREMIRYIVGSVENIPPIYEKIDFIIHGASPTASNYFVEYPVDLINIAVRGTSNILELAKDKNVSSIVYLSSMEVYGAPKVDNEIEETQGCTLDAMAVRSCYPISKRLCENLCASYGKQYGVHARVIRLAQTFGPGVASDDKRLFAQIARAVINHEDIFLQTMGNSKRCYLYTVDAVTAILLILLKGEDGKAYNVANPNTYCSIVDMVQMVIHDIANDTICMNLPEQENRERYGYSPEHYLNLDVKKVSGLGWHATKDLREMFMRLIGSMLGNKNTEV